MSRVKQREDVFYRMLDQFGTELVRTSDRPVCARVTYLPHTGILMTLEYIT